MQETDLSAQQKPASEVYRACHEIGFAEVIDRTSTELPYGLQRRLEIALDDSRPDQISVTGRAHSWPQQHRIRRSGGHYPLDPRPARLRHPSLSTTT